ncbi:MAG: hypothetical protein P8X82_09555 [Gemmatimonadales bacterium]
MDRLNSWLAVLANLGVLVGIIVVVLELNQNSEMVRAQTRNELSNGIVGLLSAGAENSELASIMRRANSGEELTADEFVQFEERQAAMYRYWENVHYQYRQGLYDETEFSKQLEAWRAYVNQSKAVADQWCKFRSIVAEDFAAEVDGLLVRFSC